MRLIKGDTGNLDNGSFGVLKGLVETRFGISGFRRLRA